MRMFVTFCIMNDTFHTFPARKVLDQTQPWCKRVFVTCTITRTSITLHTPSTEKLSTKLSYGAGLLILLFVSFTLLAFVQLLI